MGTKISPRLAPSSALASFSVMFGRLLSQSARELQQGRSRWQSRYLFQL